jgi:4a-hydroxytetrahydrobiopterin dehydratase
MTMAKEDQLIQTKSLRGSTSALSADHLRESLSRLGPEWSVVDDTALVREYAFGDFASALKFTAAVGELALKLEHFPAITLAFGRVELKIRTPRAGGLTDLDFLLAFRADKLYPK